MTTVQQVFLPQFLISKFSNLLKFWSFQITPFFVNNVTSVHRQFIKVYIIRAKLTKLFGHLGFFLSPMNMIASFTLSLVFQLISPTDSIIGNIIISPPLEKFQWFLFLFAWIVPIFCYHIVNIWCLFYLQHNFLLKQHMDANCDLPCTINPKSFFSAS